MSTRKKKLSDKLKRYNILLIIALVVLMLLLGTLMVVQMFGGRAYYRAESRLDQIHEAQESDSDDHETIGWVRVQGTNIDYPVFGILSEDFDYPVTVNSFTWSLSYDSDFHDAMIIYGHNIMNLGPNPRLHDEAFTRMEELMGFVYYDFAQENQFMQLSMNGENYIYKIYAVSFLDSVELDAYPKGDFSKEVKATYMNEILDNSIYDYEVDVKEDDKILSVVTCTKFFKDGESYDFIVTGRLVREGEHVTPSTLHRNKNYERVNEMLKGAEDNESEEIA